MNKEAFNMDAVKRILTSIGVAGAIGGGIAGVGALIDQYKVHKREISLPMYFDQMLTKNPDVKELYTRSKADKERVEDLFKLLEHFAPKLVDNALAAGTFIRQLAKYGDLGASVDNIQTLASINKNIVDSNKGKTSWDSTLMGKLFESGVAAPMSSPHWTKSHDGLTENETSNFNSWS